MINSKQRGFLTGLASREAVFTQLGKGGPTEAFAAQLATLLERHELVKVKFVDYKDQKKEISTSLAKVTSSELVRVIGNTAIFFRQQPDPEKRLIELP